MRFISGTHKGRVISGPPGEATRPTTDLLKESIFSVIEHHGTIASRRVLDLYAGSGQMGFEALSRGALHVTFVDSSVEICKHLRLLALDFGFNSAVSIARSDAAAFIEHGGLRDIDLIFVDPPYTGKLCNKIAHVLTRSSCYVAGAIVVFEHGDQEALVEVPETTLLWNRGRGSTVVDILRFNHPLL